MEKDVGQKPSAPAVGMPVPAVAAAARKDDGKAIPLTNTAQSRLLRELGVRAFRYTQEERRDIILKYTMKKTNRQGVESPVKVKLQSCLQGCKIHALHLKERKSMGCMDPCNMS